MHERILRRASALRRAILTLTVEASVRPRGG
jgi:hypothetical protein